MALRRGLHIDDDDEPLPKYEYQSLEAGRKKNNTEKDLDSMLFGGAPVRRREKPAENKPVESKPSENKVIENKSIDKNISGNKQPLFKQTQSKIVQSIEKNKATTQNKQKVEEISSNNKQSIIEQNTSKNKNEKLKAGPSNANTSAKEIGIESSKNIDKKPIEKKINNYVSLTESETNQLILVPIPEQPEKYENIPITDEEIFIIQNKVMYNKPGYLRKLKQTAEDFNFEHENTTNHLAIDVIRPFQTDRARQRKSKEIDFHDFQFPAMSISLGIAYKDKKSVWKIPNELCKMVTFGKYVDPNDIRPGVLSSSNFLSVLSVVSQFEINIKRILQNQKYNTNGFYLIRLFINSVWRYIIVDSQLPFIGNENAGVNSYEDSEFELSTALIEKAYAKIFGGYDIFAKKQSMSYYLRDLTGAPVFKYNIDNVDLNSLLKKAISKNHIILAVPNQKVANLGLNPNYAFNLINLTSKGNFELRNSWGTLDEKSKINFSKEGIFQLTAIQVKDLLSHVLIGQVYQNYFTTTIQSKHKFGFYSTYKFKIMKQTHGYISISQWDKRLFPTGKEYQYSPFRVIIQRTNPNGSSSFINGGFSQFSRDLDVELNLTPGQYTVLASGHWNSKQYDYNLVFYGSEKVIFERIHTDSFPNFISKSLEAANIQFGRKINSNNKNQYFLYHKLTNLILVTIQNNTDKEIIANQDFSKINFKSLSLLTAKDSEQNYVNKISSELEEYKQSANEDRRWKVVLAPHHNFTWIISTSLPFNEDNIKIWGFK